MSDTVSKTFKLVKPKSKKIHPMTISNDFVTLFSFHNAEVERVIPKGKGKSTAKVEERFPIIMVWDGKEMSYSKAEKGDEINILGKTYHIDREVDDVFPYLPTEDFVFEMCSPGFKKKIDEFDPKELFDEVLKFYEYFFFFESKMLYHLVSLFSVHQCVFDAYNSTPYLFVRSPLEECGKSNLGKAIQQMWNGIISTNLEAQHVYRMIHGCSPTFVFDESKSWDVKGKTDPRMQALLSVLNCGYQRGVPVYRFKDSGTGKGFGNMKPEAYDSYGPKVIISTQASIPRDTMSRCAEIMMQRAPTGSPYADRWNHKHPGSNQLLRDAWFKSIRRKAVIFRLKYGMEIKSMAENNNWRDELDSMSVFDKMSNRHLEIFKPLAILCLKYKPEWAEITAKYIREFIIMRSKVTYSKEMTVLWALRKLYSLVESNYGEYTYTSELPVKFEDTKEDGQVMWASAKIIRRTMDEFGLGSIEEFGRFPESTIGRILSEFGFIGTSRTRDGNMRMIKTARLSERCLTYLGVTLSEGNELSQQERYELIARKIREYQSISIDDLYTQLNGLIEQDRILDIVKDMRKHGAVMSSGKDGQGVITWCGVE